jgi:PAS domain S-box-containing protein
MRSSSEPVVHAGAGPREGDPGFLGEAQYRAIFEASRDALLVADARTGMLLDANPAAVALLGRSLEGIRAMHQSDVHSLEDLDAGRDSFEKRRYRSGTTEHTLVRADGARIPVEISASPMSGPQGQEWVLGSFHDLTERAEADQALRTSEARLRGITDSTSDAILMMNHRGEITFWNPAAESILGYRSDEAMGRNLHALLAPERYHAAFQQHFPSFLLTGRGAAIGTTLELTARRKDDSEIAVDLSLSGVRVGGEWHAVGILRDITARKAAAEALAASEKKFRQMAEHIREVFWIMPPNLAELATSDAGKDFYVSPAYEQVWGRSRESLYADPAAWLHSIHPEDVERTHALFNPPAPVDTEFRILTIGASGRYGDTGRSDSRFCWQSLRSSPNVYRNS